jgi:hypothetical protein
MWHHKKANPRTKDVFIRTGLCAVTPNPSLENEAPYTHCLVQERAAHNRQEALMATRTGSLFMFAIASALSLSLVPITTGCGSAPGEQVVVGEDDMRHRRDAGATDTVDSGVVDSGTTPDVVTSVDSAVSQNDMGLGHDAPNALPGEAPAVMVGTGYLDDTDPQDCYAFTLLAGQTIGGFIGTDAAEENFSWIGWAESTSWGAAGSGALGIGGDPPGHMIGEGGWQETAPSTGGPYQYTLCVNRGIGEGVNPNTGIPGNTGAGTYHLTVGITGQNDMGLGKDAPNDIGSAVPPAVMTGTGHLDDADPQDCYLFTMLAGQTIGGVIGTDSAEENFSWIGWTESTSWGVTGSGALGVGGDPPGTLIGEGGWQETAPATGGPYHYVLCINRGIGAGINPNTGKGETGSGTYHLTVNIQ